MNRPDPNARMDAGLAAVTATDEAELWDQASEDAFDQALALVEQPGSDAGTFALLGVGLALRATSARLDGLAEQIFHLVDARTEPERPTAGSDSGCTDPATTQTTSKDEDAPADPAGSAVTGDGVAHIIPLQRLQSPATRSRTARS